MNEENLEKEVLKLTLSSLPNIYLFDIFNDAVINYAYVDGKFTVINKTTLTSYLDDIKTNVKEQYLKEYMNSISIPKLEENKNNGNIKLEFKYQTLNNKWFKNTCMLVDNNGSNCILVFNKEEDKAPVSYTSVSRDSKFNTLVDNVSDAMLKIYNIFNIDSKKISNINAVEKYIESVLQGLTNTYPEIKKSFNKVAADVSSKVGESLLIVDDDLVTRNMIKKVFEDDYKILTATNGKEAIELLESNDKKQVIEEKENILAIFLDLTMPVLDGFAVLEYLNKNNYLTKIPVVIISGDYEKETKARVYNYNIADMLEKPFDFDVVRHRIGNFINLYKSSNSLSNIISEQSTDLKDIINAFINTYEYDYKDNILRIKEYMQILGNQVLEDYPEYNLTSLDVSNMVDAIEYYDIGFYSLPRTMLKNTEFSDEDLKTIKEYPLFGAKMISYVFSLMADDKLKDYALEITKYYHENYDGTGYPLSLSGDKIPLSAQIAAVAITYNNLYKKSASDIENIIISKSGTMFNPKIVGSYMKVIDQFKKIK